MLISILLPLFEGRVDERSTVIAQPFSFQRYSSAFFLRHTLSTSPHPPALGGLCALSLLNPIIHRDCSSTVRGLSPFYFLFFSLSLSELPPAFPFEHSHLQREHIYHTTKYDTRMCVTISVRLTVVRFPSDTRFIG